MNKFKLALLLVVSLVMTNVAYAKSYAPDKVLHAKVSFAMASTAYVINEHYGRSHVETFLECVGVGVLKEAYDEYSYGGFDSKDLAADALGCASGVLLMDTGFKLYSGSSEVGINYSLDF